MIASLSALLLLSLSVGTVVSSYLAIENWQTAVGLSDALKDSNEQRRLAEKAEQQSRLLLYGSDMPQIQAACEAGDFARANRLLRRHIPSAGQCDLREFCWQLWNNWANCELRVIDTSDKNNVVQISQDGSALGEYVQADAQIRFWDLNNGKLLTTVTKIPEDAISSAFSLASNVLAVGCRSGQLCVYDITTDELVFSTGTNEGHATDNVTGIGILALAPDGHMYRYEWQGCTNPHMGPSFERANWRGALQWCCPGSCVLARREHSGSRGKRLTRSVWDIIGQTVKYEVKLEYDGYAAAFAANGRILGIGGEFGRDLSLRCGDWSYTSHLPWFTWGFVTKLSFSPGGHGLASVGANDRLVKYWEVDSGGLIHTFGGHTAPVTQVLHISDDVIASYGLDQTVRLWNTQRENRNHKRLDLALIEVRLASGSHLIVTRSCWEPIQESNCTTCGISRCVRGSRTLATFLQLLFRTMVNSLPRETILAGCTLLMPAPEKLSPARGTC